MEKVVSIYSPGSFNKIIDELMNKTMLFNFFFSFF